MIPGCMNARWAPGNPCLKSAFTNPVVDTVSAKPGGVPEPIQSHSPNKLTSQRSLQLAPITVLVGLYMVIETIGIWVIGLIGAIAIAGLLILPGTNTWVATETNRF